MSTFYYDVYKNPFQSLDGEAEETYHVRPVRNQCVSTERLRTGQASTLTSADLVAAFELLHLFLAENLGEGRQVHVEGIGYFQVTLELADLACEETQDGEKVWIKQKRIVTSPEQIRAEHIRIKSVSFRPEKKLLNELTARKGAITRTPVKQHSGELSDSEVERRLRDYFQRESVLDRARFEKLCEFTRTTALRRLKRLLEAGVLCNIGKRNAPLYVLA